MCGDELVALLTGGTSLATSAIRSPVSDPDPDARRRLDLALRTLQSQPAAHWCRPAGDGTAVVLRWPLPARGVALYPAVIDGPALLLLAVGRAGGAPDVWRFRWDGEPVDSLGARARGLLACLA